MSNTVSKALELFVGEEAKETAKFASMFDRFFDCMNVTNFSAGTHSQNPFKSPYRSATDFRLKVNVFIGLIVYALINIVA